MSERQPKISLDLTSEPVAFEPANFDYLEEPSYFDCLEKSSYFDCSEEYPIASFESK